MQKKISILIVPEDGKVKKYVFSQRRIKILVSFVVLIFIGILWFAYEYSDLIYKDIKIRALEAKNKELMEKSRKFILFENEFNALKSRTTKIANMLGVEYSEAVEAERPPLQLDTSAKRPVIMGEKLVPCIKPVDGWISKKFSSDHTAVDFAAKFGAEILSSMDGKVEYTGWDDVFGYVVRITNSQGYTIIYGHLTKIKIDEGMTVKCGDLIGFVGSTGKSSAPHLHYEVLLNGVPQDPENYLGKGRQM